MPAEAITAAIVLIFILQAPLVTGASAAVTPSKCLGPLNCPGGYVANVATGLSAVAVKFAIPTLDCAATPNGIFNFASLLSNTAYPWFATGNVAYWSGVSFSCSGGYPSYSVLMNPVPRRSITVSPGDVILAGVSASTTTINVTLRDITTGQGAFGSQSISGWTPTAAACGGGSTGTYSSVLIDFGALHVSYCRVSANGVTAGIGTLPNVYRVFIYNSDGSTMLAYPSKLTSYQAFTLTWVTSG